MAKVAGARYSPSRGATTTTVPFALTVSFRTPVAKTNGFNLAWREELCLPFNCADDRDMELIFVEFVVREDVKSGDHELYTDIVSLNFSAYPTLFSSWVDLRFT